MERQQDYWNRVANEKTFTHPIDLELVGRYLVPDALLVDYGCGYGRVVKDMEEAGYTNISGYDTSEALIARGRAAGVLNIYSIARAEELPVPDGSVDMVLLFAVLTCIPSNKEQRALVKLLQSKLRPGGFLYISDYYLQPGSTEMERYEYLDGDKDNYGVFTLPEGATFRHHTREWINTLLADFALVDERTIEVRTMNGHSAEAFQIVAMRKGN